MEKTSEGRQIKKFVMEVLHKHGNPFQLICGNFKALIISSNWFLEGNKNEEKDVPLYAINIIQYGHYLFPVVK